MGSISKDRAKARRNLALLLGIFVGIASCPAGDRLALVVGNDAYQNTASLKNAVNDARAMKRVLDGVGFTVSKAEDADRAGLDNAINAFIDQLGKDDLALFFFAGHGVQLDGLNYLLPTDFDAADETQAKFRAIAVDEVTQRMESRKCRVNIVVLDACRDNPFRGIRSGRRGLAATTGGRGTLIAFATGPNKTASDGPSGTNGLFTGKLIEVIPKPGLHVEEVFRRTRHLVDKASAGKQTPFLVSGVVGNVYFKPPVAGTPPTPPPQAEPYTGIVTSPPPDLPVSEGKTPRIPGRYPFSSMRFVNRDDFRGLNAWDLRIMRNEIYARHGYRFQSQDLQAHFSREEWFTPTTASMDAVEAKFNDIESLNVDIIKNYETMASSHEARKVTTTPGRFPEASERRLTDSDLAGRSRFELRLMRNEIYARHGRIFSSRDLREHFSKQHWYTGRFKNVDGKLSLVEEANVALIMRHERNAP